VRALCSRVTLLVRLCLQSRPQLDIVAKFTPSFAKLPKLQTPNAKLLDTFFRAFWQITQMQTTNTKLLKMLQNHETLCRRSVSPNESSLTQVNHGIPKDFQSSLTI